MTRRPPRTARGTEVLRRLRWPHARRLGGHMPGDASSRFLGPGIEYADFREYQPGEDARLIDWNLTARSDRPYVRHSHPDRGLDAWFIVDASRSLHWGTARALKKDAAMDLVEMATLVLARHGSRVGGIVFDTRVRRVLGLTAGRNGRLQLISRLAAEMDRPGEPGATDIAGALRRAERMIHRPSLVIVVSDFLGDQGWQRPLKALAVRHDVVAVRVVDPRELDLPMVGIVTLEDPETGRQLDVDTTSRRFRERYRAAAAAQRERIRHDLRAARADVFEMTNAEPVVRQLVDFIQARRARRGSSSFVRAR